MIAHPTSLLPGHIRKEQPVSAGLTDSVPPANATATGLSNDPKNVKPSQRLAAVALGLIGVGGAAWYVSLSTTLACGSLIV